MQSLTRPAYTSTQRLLHWITALFVFATIPLAIAMTNVGEGPMMDRLYNLHWSFGFLILFTVLFRLWVRAKNPPAPLPDTIPAIQAKIAHWTHVLLYVLLIAMPIGGWIGKSAYGGAIYIFWIIPMPAIWAHNPAFGERILGMHTAAGIFMTLLLFAHIGAAMMHHFVKKDGIMLRMIRD